MREKIVQIIKKIISLGLVSSLLIGNMFSYVHARDFKLSIIYLLDAVEDIEYASRENEYHSEHENVLSTDKNSESDFVGESENIGASTASQEEVGASSASPSTIKDEPSSEYASEPEDDIISSDSEVDNKEKQDEDEPEDDTVSTKSDLEEEDSEEEESISTNSEILKDDDQEKEDKEKKATESIVEEIVSTPSGLEDTIMATESEIIDIATVSTVKNGVIRTVSEDLFGSSAEELFVKPVIGSTFSLKSVTKKTVRGGMTCEGVILCGLMQTGNGTTNTYMRTECTHADRHKVEFSLWKDNEEGDQLVRIVTETPNLSIAYPDYSSYGDYTEPKEYNVQSEVILARDLLLNKIYHVTEKASGCKDFTYTNIHVSEGYTPPPQPVKVKHGTISYDTSDGTASGIVRDVDNSSFLLYKVKYGDSFERIAVHYGRDDVDEVARDNHMVKDAATQRYMCYEGNILFIRNPDPVKSREPYENELTQEQLDYMREREDLVGYEKALCEFYGEPINMSTGDFYLEHTDIEIPELGDTNFRFSRSYNSIGRILRSDFGYGFNSLVNDRLMVNTNGTVTHFAADGGGETYRTNRDGTYIASKGNNVLIAIKDESGSRYGDDEYDDSGDTEGLDEDDPGYSVGGSNFWKLQYEDGSTALYNGYGTLLSKTDKRGLSYYYNYDNKFRVTNISFPSGASIGFNYNTSNLISKITLPDNTYITYEYDEHKNLIKVINQENRTIRYKYDDNGVDPKEHLMTSWYDEDNIRQVLNTYDSKGRVVKQIDANGNESTLTYESDRTIVMDNEGKERVFMLDEKKRTSGRLFAGSSSVGASLASPDYTKTFTENSKIDTIVDGNGVTTKYTYDERGNVINEEKTDGAYSISRSWTYDENSNKTSETDYNGNITTYTYDANNNLTKITDANGNSEIMTYDNFSRLTSKKDKRGNITRYTYSGIEPLPETITDAKGNITRFTYDTMRRKLSETDARGNTITYTYDRTGRKLKEVDKRGNETDYTYSSRGTVTSIKDREDNISTFTYDNVGNILTGTDAENNTLTYEYDRNYNKVLEKDPLQQEKKMVYNDKGQVIEEIDALNHSKRYTLDAVGNIIKEIDRNGNEINYRYNNVLNKVIEKTDGNGKITRYNYDNNGNLLKEIKPDGSEINYEYDSLNQLIKRVDEVGTETSFTYDPNRNITKKSVEASGNVGASSASPRTTLYTYDACNNLVEEKSPNGYINKCEYDQVGNIIKLTDENNYTIEYTYDANSNITRIKDAENHTEEYTYNKENKKKTYKDKNGHITTFNYDRAGRVVEKINALNEKEKLVYDANDNITKNTLYNADGSIFSETNRTYNALNKVVEEKDALNHTTTYTYDNNENVISITNKNGDIKTFTYDASNNVTKVIDEMGLITEYEYDDNYNVIKISDNSFVGASTASPEGVGASYTSPTEIREYDRVGNLVKVVDALNREEKYEYNAFGEQIKKIDKDNAITLYNYDNNGNLIKVVRPDNQELIYTYDKHNKLIKTKLNDVEYEYTYDKNYNVIKEKNPLGNFVEWTYDNEGNTTKVKDEEGNITTNEYDSTGRLIKQTDGRNNNVTLKYDRNNKITEVKTAENIINKFEYDKEGRLTKEIDGENHFVEYEYDNIGNILKKTTESNEITTYTYDKHNIMTSMTDALGNIETYDTNLSGKITKKTQKDGTIYQYNYDRAKRLINTIDPMNYKINFEYSLGDDVVKTTDTLGRQANYEYDIMHNLTKQVVGSTIVGASSASPNIRPLTTEWWFYDQRGNVIRHMDRREYLEYFTYDKANNLIEHKDKNGNITRYTYDKVGNIKEVIKPNGAKTLYDYDANYNRISLTNPRGKVTSYVYDRDNRLISETDPNGNTKRYNYNNNNNLTKTTSALGNINQYIYDTDNNLIKEIDPRNKEKNYTYDKLHRLTKTTSEMNNTANFTYDVVDNVIGVKDPKGTNIVFNYNSIGKVIQERSVDNTIRTYDYDRAGRLISKINKDRTKIAYDYDENDNIIAKYYLDLHNQETDDKIVYSYNGENMRLGMRDKSGLSRTLYDSNGNMIVSTSNNDKDIVKYEYDANNRLIKMIYPNNIVVTYTYDENGNIKTVTDKDGLKTTYTYDDNDNEVIRTTGNIETNKRYDADNRLIRVKNEHRFTGELIDEYSYRYDSNNNIIEEIKREPYKKKVETFDIEPIVENDHTIRVTKQTFTYDAENKLTDARVERLGMKGLSEPNVTTYHYEYDQNGNRTLVEIKDDGLTLESTVYEYNRLNQMIRSREVTAKGLYIYEYRYDDNGNLISEDRHRIYETQPVFYTNIRRYEYTKDNKLEAVYSGNTLLVAYSYDGDGTITSTLDRDLDFNQNLNINDRSYMNSLTNNQRRLINKINPSDTILYEMTEYVLERNQEYSQVLMERDGAGNLSTIYTYGNQRINSESYPNLSGLYTYDGRGSVSAVIGGYGDFRATYWYDGLGNVKSQIHGFGVFGSGKKYYGYNAESYNPVTGNQNLRNRQVNIRRQRFLTEDTYLGKKNNPLTLNRYIYGNDNPLKYKDPSGYISIGEVVNITSEVISNSFKTNLTDAIIKKGVSEMSSLPRTDINDNGDGYIRGTYREGLPDYTDAINDMLERERRNYEIVNIAANVIGGVIDSSFIRTGVVTEAIKYGYFYWEERTGGRLDIKNERQWNTVFNNNPQYPGGTEVPFLYNNEVITPSQLGNIAYGYWGKSLGFSDETLFYGGGFARLKKEGKLSDNIYNRLVTDIYYGDMPEDIEDIMKGIELYNKQHYFGCHGGN